MMRSILLLLLVTLTSSGIAYAERSYLLIPDAVEEAEQLAETAGALGRGYMNQAPRTANEAMGKLRHIDHDLDRIIPLARRFQQTTRLLEKGIRDVQIFADQNRRFVAEWGPVLQGNYYLMHAVYEKTNRNDIRTLVAMAIMENLVHSMSMRIASAEMAVNLELKYTKEAEIIAAAHQRLHRQFTRIRQDLKTIQNVARARM